MRDAFKKHNEPLDQRMRDTGGKLVHTNDHTFYADKEGKYMPFLPGYITGPTDSYNSDPSCDFYVSVRAANGCWNQRGFRRGQEKEAEEWALTEAATHISQPD